MDTYEKLKREFNSRGIPTDSPDFYDHPNFLKAEKEDSDYLINYAAFVALKPYTPEYLNRARNVITQTAEILQYELQSNGRQGACVDISGIFARILERKGIWCAGIKGSCTIEFPAKTKEEKTFFWAVDQGNFFAGHSWLFTPPFNIVDISIREQPYTGNKKKYIPKILLNEKENPATVEIKDIISPTIINALKKEGIPEEQFFQIVASNMKYIQKLIPAIKVESESGTTLKYSPAAIHASEEPLEEMRNMDFDGKTPFELYKDKLESV